jgi:hypothetical protein
MIKERWMISIIIVSCFILRLIKEYFSHPNARVLYVLFNLCLISNPLVKQ